MARRQEFDFSVDLLRVVLWQYNNTPNLQSIITQKQQWYIDNQTEFWSDWMVDVFDLRTANDFGLSVWAIILDLPLVATLPPSDLDKPTWGFSNNNENFGNGNFSSKTSTSAGLTLEQRRIALRLRYIQLVSRGTIPEINEFMNLIFGERRVYALDPNDMSITYVFTFQPDSSLSLVLESFDLLPRPSGVRLRTIVATRPVFGFGSFNLNFDNGNFLPQQR